MIDITSYLIHTVHAAEEAVHTTEASGGVAAMFGLNLKLFIAQLINFGIVLFVLWKWVFTPVTKALQKRTAKIEESLRTAEKVEQDKSEFEKWKKSEMAKARSEAADIVTKAKGEAEIVRTELLTKAKQEQEKIFTEGQERLVQEQTKMLHEAKGQLAELVVAATEKVLGEKMTEKKDAELAKKALEAIK